MPAYTFFFLRHAQSEGNTENYFQGRSDTSLTEAGLRQAQALAERWKKENRTFDRIICSTLGRAKSTARILADALKTEFITDPLWLERDTGKLTQVYRDKTNDLPYFHDFYTPFDQMGETGEGDWDLYVRACQALRSLLLNPPGTYLVVSHGGLLNQVIRAIAGVTPQPNTMGVQFRFDNTGFTIVNYDPTSYKWSIIKMNDTHHLSGLQE